MKSGLKYTQSFGKCNEQDMTFRIPCAQRAAIPVQDGSTVRSACANPLAAVVHGRSAHVTGRRIGGRNACTRKRLLPNAANEVVPRRTTGADAPFGLRLRGRWDTFLCLYLS